MTKISITKSRSGHWTLTVNKVVGKTVTGRNILDLIARHEKLASHAAARELAKQYV